MTRATFRTTLSLLFLGAALLAVAPASQAQKAPKFAAAAVEVKFVEAEVSLPPEFQVALYENLIEEVKKTGKFENVFRDGDSAAAGAKDLITLRSNVRLFKKGSAMARQTTTVAGATKITVHVQMARPDGRMIIDRDVEGNVRFFGENLGATRDFAKDVAKLIKKTF